MQKKKLAVTNRVQHTLPRLTQNESGVAMLSVYTVQEVEVGMLEVVVGVLHVVAAIGGLVVSVNVVIIHQAANSSSVVSSSVISSSGLCIAPVIQHMGQRSGNYLKSSMLFVTYCCHILSTKLKDLFTITFIAVLLPGRRRSGTSRSDLDALREFSFCTKYYYESITIAIITKHLPNHTQPGSCAYGTCLSQSVCVWAGTSAAGD